MLSKLRLKYLAPRVGFEPTTLKLLAPRDFPRTRNYILTISIDLGLGCIVSEPSKFVMEFGSAAGYHGKSALGFTQFSQFFILKFPLRAANYHSFPRYRCATGDCERTRYYIIRMCLILYTFYLPVCFFPRGGIFSSDACCTKDGYIFKSVKRLTDYLG